MKEWQMSPDFIDNYNNNNLIIDKWIDVNKNDYIF